MSHGARVFASLAVGVAAMLVAVFVLAPAGCDDMGGVPSWERCTTFIGTPAFYVEDFGWISTLNWVQPVLVGLLVGLITWGLAGLSGETRADSEERQL